MGDRANIVVRQVNYAASTPTQKVKQDIFLYTHWSRSELPDILQSALKRGEPRWRDDAYLARIIFCEMVQGCVMEGTGFGIGVSQPDNSYPWLVVDPDEQTVTVDAKCGGEQPKSVLAHGKFTFAEYVALPEASWSYFEGSGTA